MTAERLVNILGLFPAHLVNVPLFHVPTRFRTTTILAAIVAPSVEPVAGLVLAFVIALVLAFSFHRNMFALVLALAAFAFSAFHLADFHWLRLLTARAMHHLLTRDLYVERITKDAGRCTAACRPASPPQLAEWL